MSGEDPIVIRRRQLLDRSAALRDQISEDAASVVNSAPWIDRGLRVARTASSNKAIMAVLALLTVVAGPTRAARAASRGWLA
ncbi:MAG: hypothetical protein FGM43_04590, partial [Sinobacteraceae bacterium]|nr:hypothetical protein [Nevskiaceae bacterium]